MIITYKYNYCFFINNRILVIFIKKWRYYLEIQNIVVPLQRFYPIFMAGVEINCLNIKILDWRLLPVKVAFFLYK
jgi:hypothetical protein